MRPYLLRALLEWVNDNDMTPHIIVDASMPDVNVPEQAISDGKVVLNVSPLAAPDLQVNNDCVSFSTRFSGRVFPVSLPLPSIVAVFSKESGQGMALPPEIAPTEQPVPPTPDEEKAARRAHLSVVK